MSTKFFIDPDISKAETLPASFYRDPEIFEAIKNKIFYKSWHWLGHQDLVDNPPHVHPMVLLDNFMTKPLVFDKDENENIPCLSYVCTHKSKPRGEFFRERPKKVKPGGLSWGGRV